jgi:hypothetical protein
MKRDEAVQEAQARAKSYGHDLPPFTWESNGDGFALCECGAYAYALNKTTRDDDGEVYSITGKAVNYACTKPGRELVAEGESYGQAGDRAAREKGLEGPHGAAFAMGYACELSGQPRSVPPLRALGAPEGCEWSWSQGWDEARARRGALAATANDVERVLLGVADNAPTSTGGVSPFNAQSARDFI